jgi:hypothetical protein
MSALGWKVVALACAGLGLMLAEHAAAQDDEIVVYGKRPAAIELDRAPLRIDVRDHAERIAEKLEAALAGTAPRPASRVAATERRARG